MEPELITFSTRVWDENNRRLRQFTFNACKMGDVGWTCAVRHDSFEVMNMLVKDMDMAMKLMGREFDEWAREITASSALACTTGLA